jgi:hypothetical protein
MTEVTPPSTPAEPTTPAEAQARLSQVKQDQTWTKAFLEGGPKQPDPPEPRTNALAPHR